MELVADKMLLYIINKNQSKLSTMCRFFSNLFAVTGNDDAMCDINRICDRNFNPKQSIIIFEIS